jgi:hypothetical protein
VERSTVQRWEAGETTPRAWYWPTLANALGLPIEQLNDLLTERNLPTVAVPDLSADDPLAIADTAARESLAFATQMAEGSVSAELLEHLHWEISRIAVDYVSTPVHRLLGGLVTTRNVIFECLRKHHRPQVLRDLYLLGGATCLLLAHASQNVGNQRAALIQLHTATTCAEIADHNALRAWSRGTAALINEWSLRPRASVDLAEQGLRFPASKESRVRLRAIEARGAARMNDRVLALDALDQIQAVQGDVDGYDDITEFGGLFSFPSAKQEYYLGSTFGLLGEHDKAEQHATAAIAAYENGLPAERSYGDEALARLDVVNSRLERGEVDGAVEAAAPVLGLPAERRIRQLDTAVGRTWRILQQPRFTSSTAARTLLDDLRQYRDQAARERSALPSA